MGMFDGVRETVRATYQKRTTTDPRTATAEASDTSWCEES